MRVNETMNDNYCGSYNHTRKLRVGDVQKMTWMDDGEGPYHIYEQ